MTAAILPFPKSVAFPVQQPDVAARSANRAVVLGRTSGRLGKSLNPGTIVKIRSSTKSAVVICRVQYMAGEQAAVCANLAGLFSIRGASVEFLNFCRPFGRPATLLRALQAGKQSARGISETFQVFLRWFVGFHADQSSMEPKACRTQIKGIRNP